MYMQIVFYIVLFLLYKKNKRRTLKLDTEYVEKFAKFKLKQNNENNKISFNNKSLLLDINASIIRFFLYSLYVNSNSKFKFNFVYVYFIQTDSKTLISDNKVFFTFQLIGKFTRKQ